LTVIYDIERAKDGTEDEGLRRHFEGSLPDCFLCGEPVDPPIIVWAGTADLRHDQGWHLHPHPECTKDLAVALFRDVSEGKNVSKALPP
jgi:hypothetical protein